MEYSSLVARGILSPTGPLERASPRRPLSHYQEDRHVLDTTQGKHLIYSRGTDHKWREYFLGEQAESCYSLRKVIVMPKENPIE